MRRIAKALAFSSAFACAPREEVVCSDDVPPGAHVTTALFQGPNIARQAAEFHCENSLRGEVRILGPRVTFRGEEEDARWFDAMISGFSTEPESSRAELYWCTGTASFDERVDDARQFVTGGSRTVTPVRNGWLERAKSESDARDLAKRFCKEKATRFGEAYAIGSRVYLSDDVSVIRLWELEAMR